MPNQPRPGTHVRGIRMDDDLWEQVRTLAAARSVTASEVVRVAVAEHVERA